jgi:uncharacterized RDD family membrane protein YckC
MNKYNTFWKRLVAALIDSLILLPLTLITAYAEATENNFIFLFSISIFSVLNSAYFIFLHGKYGQTLGKRITGIQVLDKDEILFIGIKRAIIRESPGIITYMIVFIHLIVSLLLTHQINLTKAKEESNDFISTSSFVWIFVELITMLLNHKRRALHDYLAGSIVIRKDYLVRHTTEHM